MTVFNMHQAKTELSRLVAMAEAGKEVVIARNNIAVARIVAVRVGKGGVAGVASAPIGFSEEAQMRFSVVDNLIGDIGVPAALALKPRKPGALKGMFSLPDSFFDPLPEEELQAWEGEFSFDPDRKS